METEAGKAVRTGDRPASWSRGDGSEESPPSMADDITEKTEEGVWEGQ